MKQSFVQTGILIRADQKAWLDSHSEINFSGLIRRLIDDEMKRDG